MNILNKEERSMQELLNELFEYRDGELIRKVSTRGSKSRVGDVAGYLSPSGRVYVGVGGRYYARSRLVWIWHYGNIPDKMMIDHIDNKGSKSDDRIENLRLATRSQNGHNAEAKGYCWQDGKWKAKIKYQGKQIHLGYFDCQLDAHAAYLRAKRKLAGEFAPV